MDAIKLIGVSHNGKLTVDVPKELDEKELEIMIIASRKLVPDSKENHDNLSEEKKIEDNTII
ncbi:MAG: hypothetical protein ABI266_07205 [Ginsengibacter sp.]